MDIARGSGGSRGLRGFTMVEMLVVVAIMAVLVAIAIPAVSTLSRNMTMLRLDNYAKEIYADAQDQLISMDASGELVGFNKTLVASYNSQRVTVKPQDYLSDDSGWEYLYHISAIDTVTDDVMGKAAVSKAITDAGVYIMEVNPESGELYSVFYSEDPNFSYDDVVALATRDKADRYNDGNGYPVGYYCGGESSAVSLPDKFEPTVTVENGEELYLHIACKGSTSLVALQRYMTVNITLAQEDSTNKTVITLKGGDDFSLTSSGDLDIDVLLDSMRTDSDLHFATITGGTIKPGSNLTATVDVEFQRGDVSITTPDPVQTAAFNSLFAGYDSADGTISVAAVRHLNNIRDAYLTTGDGVQYTKVAQTSDIDFDATSWDAETLSAATIVYNQETYGSDKAVVNPLDPRSVIGAVGFTPIVNDNNKAWSYDGRNNSLYNFYITGGENTGLFGTKTYETAISNTFLVDPIVIGGSNTGALVGRLVGTVSNCGVRLSTDHGASEMADRVATYTVRGKDGATSVGGLVGLMDTGTAIVEQSYAAIDVLADSGSISKAGGLIGSCNAGDSRITTSYASGTVTASTMAGGLVGYLSSAGGDISYCYSTSDVRADTYGGGLIGQANTNSSAVSLSQAYGEVLTRSGGVDVSTSGAFLGGSLMGNQWWMPITFSNCVYLQQTGYNDGFTSVYDGVTAKHYSELATGTLSSENSHPYDKNLISAGKPFPFAQIKTGAFTQTDHWGDWPARAGMNPTIVYYEKYGDGTFGYYAVTTLSGTPTSDNDITINTLRSTGTVVEDGYALLTTYAISGFQYRLNDGSNALVTTSDTPADDHIVPLNASNLSYTLPSGETVEVGDALIYQLPFPLQETTRTASSSFFDKLDIDIASSDGKTTTTYTYYYCPHFSRDAVNPAADGTAATQPGNPTTVYVRSARQMNALSRYPYYWNAINHSGAQWSVTYEQEMDIDFGNYVTTYCGRAFNLMDTTSSNTYRNRAIGHQSDNFRYTFNGNDHLTIDYCLDGTEQFVGMFGEVYTATIKNVHMVASTEGGAYVTNSKPYQNGYTPAVGALVGLLYVQSNGESISQVTNCSVAGYNVSFAPSDGLLRQNCAVGGLVGYNMGSVSESSACNASDSISVSNRSNNTHGTIGGLVGSNAGTISKCYAGGELSATSVSSSRSSAYISMGGIAGRYYYQWTQASLAASITDCYSLCSMDAVGGGGTFEYYGIANNARTNTGTTSNSGAKSLASYSISNCYYLKNVSSANVREGQATAYGYGQMKSLSLDGFGTAATTAYDYGAGDFPYPAIVTDAEGNYIHYGSWIKPGGE